MLYAFFWVIPRRLNFICRRFGTLCLLHLHRQVGACRNLKCTHTSCVGAFQVSTRTYLPMKMAQSVPKRRNIKFRRRGNHPKESIQLSFQCYPVFTQHSNVLSTKSIPQDFVSLKAERKIPVSVRNRHLNVGPAFGKLVVSYTIQLVGEVLRQLLGWVIGRFHPFIGHEGP